MASRLRFGGGMDVRTCAHLIVAMTTVKELLLIRNQHHKQTHCVSDRGTKHVIVAWPELFTILNMNLAAQNLKLTLDQ